MKDALLVLNLVVIAATAPAQSLTVGDTLAVTVTTVERLKERRVNTPTGPQSESAPKGCEFVQLRISPRWLTDRAGDPCDETVLHRAWDFELVGTSGRVRRGMQGSWRSGPGACKTMDMLFQASPQGESFTALRWKGNEADISKVPSASGKGAATTVRGC